MDLQQNQLIQSSEWSITIEFHHEHKIEMSMWGKIYIRKTKTKIKFKNKQQKNQSIEEKKINK